MVTRFDGFAVSVVIQFYWIYGMSDFFYSRRPVRRDRMSAAFAGIPGVELSDIRYFDGPWGSLAVSRSKYRGYQLHEDKQHICVVIGGPVLYFRENDFFSVEDSNAGTRAVLERWCQGDIQWDEDVSGPFVVLIVSKHQQKILCVTDMMMCIAAYHYQTEQELAIGTHVDGLAAICGQEQAYDSAALVDFVLHGFITYPYTAYSAIRQCRPGTEHLFCLGASGEVVDDYVAYWQPEEKFRFANLAKAADFLRAGVQGYVDRAVYSLAEVAEFISGGEDSRALAGMLPERLRRRAYIFLDSVNRECRIAEKAIRAYGAEFVPDFRGPTHYLDILPEASRLAGSGQQYRHAHTLGFHDRHKLAEYPAVFGGCFSDSLLKAPFANKPKFIRRFSFLPEMVLSGEARDLQLMNSLFSSESLALVAERRRAHLTLVKKMRPHSAHEWFILWPMTMRPSISNISTNRRLFASFEPFLANEVIKVSSAVPTEWKLNRRLFHRAFKPYFRRTRWLRHSDGRLPYLPWWANMPMHFAAWVYRRVARRVGRRHANEGAWCDWSTLQNSSKWQSLVANFSQDISLPKEFASAIERGAFNSTELTVIQKVNLMQICYMARSKTQNAVAVCEPKAAVYG